MSKFITPEAAAALIPDGARIGLGGFATFGAADSVLRAMGRRYDREGSPKRLQVVCGAVTGDQQEDGWGMSTLKADGLIDSVITSHVGQSPAIARAVAENKIAAFLLPLGVFGHIFRDMSAHRPGPVTHVGLGTFVDPRVEGPAANDKARGMNLNLVEVIELNGDEYLHYSPLPMEFCVIRASLADEDGNISFENEAIPAEQVEMANAVHNNGGTVIVQVEKLVPRNSLHPRNVWLHRLMADYVVVAKPGEQPHTYESPAFRPELAGQCRVPAGEIQPMRLDIRKVIARRGALELKQNALVNLGLGISDGISTVVSEEGASDQITLTIETGIFGGTPLRGLSMGSGVNPDAMYRTCDTFDLYDGGVLDMSFLSGAEIDAQGNVNVTRFGGRVAGPGGFIDISQNTPKMCFLGAFTAGEQDIRFENGRVNIIRDGDTLKFRNAVQQISFSGAYARKSGQQVLFISERAVFRLTDRGLELTEIAPGVDLERHILARMEFRPLISPDLKQMDPRIFREEKMGLTLP